MHRILPLCLLAACAAPDDPTPPAPAPDLLEPAGGALTGYYPVLLDLSEAGLTADEVLDLRIGGVRAIDLAPQPDGRLSVLVQGAPEAGDVGIDLITGSGTVRLGQRFTYAPPLDPAFSRVVAFGASLTQGVQNGTPTHSGVMHSPALVLARQMGAYLPQPVLVDPLFPTLGLDSVGPAPECASASVVEFIQGAITDVLVELSDPEEGLAYWVGRSDPDIAVRNLAAGNFMVDDMLLGPQTAEVVQNFLGPLSLDPYADFGGGSRWTMIEAVEQLAPSLVVSFDLMGNDVLSSTPLAQMEENLPPLVQRLAATGAEVFLADMPDPAILKGSLGDDPLDNEDSALALQCNALLRAEADRYPNVHVVPLAERALAFAEGGVSVGDELLTADMLGGMLSFDGLHFSDTGYAFAADLFAEVINDTLGTAVPPVDLEAVLATDPHVPSAVRAAGREPLDCRE